MVAWNQSCGIRSQGFLFASPGWGKSKKRSLGCNWATFVNPAVCTASKSKPTMVVCNRPRGIRFQGCLFASPRWGNSDKRVFTAIRRLSSTGLFALLGKADPKWWYVTDLVEFDPKGVYSFREDGENRINAFLTHFGRPSSTRLFALLGKAHPKWWYETDLVQSDPKFVYSFRPDGEYWKTAFSPQLGDLRQPGVFALLGKAHTKWWYETDSVLFDPMGVCSLRPDGESRKIAFLTHFGRPSSTRLFTLLGKAHQKWWYENHLVEFDPTGVYSLRPDGESPKNAFWTQLDDLRQPVFLRCLEKQTQNGDTKTTSWKSIPRVFIRFAQMGKVEKTRFERNCTTFVNSAFCADWKSPPKMVVCNQPGGLRSLGCLFATPLLGKSTNRVINAIGRPSSTRLFALLWKAHPKWWYETDLVEFDPMGFYSLRPDGESRKNSFGTQLDDIGQHGFFQCLKKPTQNCGIKPTS